MTAFYPLTFKPIYQQYLWGGRRFETVLGRSLPPDGVYAESWEISDHAHQQSIVEAGPLAGTSLHQLVVDRPEGLLGRHHCLDRFPLLLKYLDANKSLSVQVHPDDKLATRMGLSDLGKTEAWYILEAAPDSEIWAGFNQPVDRQTLAQAIQNGVLERFLHRFQPKPGECLFLPAGTVHALGQGVMVAEIQQTSDNTFRLYDWNRVGTDGKPRPLHVEEGLEAIDYDQGPVEPDKPRATDQDHVKRLVDCDKFIMDRWEFSSSHECGQDRRCHVVTVLDGAVEVEGDANCRPLDSGRTVLLPAAIGPVRLTPIDRRPAVLLDAYLP